MESVYFEFYREDYKLEDVQAYSADSAEAVPS